MPGDSLTTATALSLPASPQPPLSGSLAGNNAADYYRISLIGRSNIHVELQNLSAAADLALIRDLNRNGTVETNEIIASSHNGGTIGNLISTQVEAGLYYLRVQGGATATNYSLNVQGATAISRFYELGSFNGDLNSDLILDNATTKQKALWFMSGTTPTGGALLNASGGFAEWDIAFTGDFNNDGKKDFIIENRTTNQKAIWLMNGAQIMMGRLLPDIDWTKWTIKAVTNFDSDGKSDLLLTKEWTGEKAIWLMDGAVLKGGVMLPNPGWEWQVQETSDFNGDGKADILLSHVNTREKAIWFMNGGAVVSGSVLPTPDWNQWFIEKTADFNGDGKADLLLRKHVGADAVIWLMNGATVTAGAYLPSQSGWQVLAVQDLDGDRKADFLLENNSTQEKAIWFMDGTTVKTGSLLPNPDWTQWRIAQIGDFNGDRKADYVLENTTTASRAIWLMNGATVLSTKTLVLPEGWQLQQKGAVVPALEGVGSTPYFAFNMGTLDVSSEATYQVSSSSYTDFYRFTVQAGTTMKFSITSNSPYASGKLYNDLSASNAMYSWGMQPPASPNMTQTIAFSRTLNPGDYLIQLSDPQTYTLTLETGTNTAPVLNSAIVPTLQTIDLMNPASSQGTLVSDLVSNISDIDSGSLKGIAITGLDDRVGFWEYTLDGRSWSSLYSPNPGPSSQSAFLIAADRTTRLRFNPKPGFVGPSVLSYRAWDQTTGTAGTLTPIQTVGGSSAFSTETGTAKVIVSGLGMLREVNPGPISSAPREMVLVKNDIYYVATNAQGETQLFRQDADRSLPPMPIIGLDTNPVPSKLMNVNGTLYFFANISGMGRELWQLDTATPNALPQIVRDIAPMAASSELINLPAGSSTMAALNNDLVFLAMDANQQTQLWLTNGTPGGTQLLSLMINRPNATISADLVTHNGIVYFTADDGINGKELWRTDGTVQGTFMLKDIVFGSSNPTSLTNVNGTVYFAATYKTEMQIWKTDGTSQGTSMVYVTPFSGATEGLTLSQLTNVDGTLFFTETAGTQGSRIFKVDQTGQVVPVYGNYGANGATLAQFTNVNGKLFFVETSSTMRRLFQVDTTSGSSAQEVFVGGSPASITIANFNGKLAIVTQEMSQSTLHMLDVTTPYPQSQMVRSFWGGIDVSSPLRLTVVNGMLYFLGGDFSSGYEVWRTDGTQIGTQRVQPYSPGGLTITGLSVGADQVLLSAETGQFGNELWVLA